MKKIKDSAKAEMKKAVQKELSKIMAKQIAKEDLFKNMMQEILSDFFEEIDVKEEKQEESTFNLFPWQRGYKNVNERIKTLAGIQSGDHKEEFSKMINKDVNSISCDFSKNVSDLNSRLIRKGNSNVLLTDDQMKTLFDPARLAEKVKTIPNPLLFREANPINMSKLASISKEQAEADYFRGMNYTKEMIDSLFKYINENKLSLEATHDQWEANNNSIEKFHVKNKEPKDLEENEEFRRFYTPKINPKYFAFCIEVKTRLTTKIKTFSLIDVYLNGESLPFGSIGLEDIIKLLELAKEIYSDTIILPLSQTNPEENQTKKT